MTDTAPRRGPWRVVLLVLLPVALIALAVLRLTHLQPWLESQNVLAIEQVLNDQNDAWNRGDLEGFMQGYWRSPELTFYSEDKVRQGWDETFDRYRQRYQAEGKEMGHLTFSDQRIDVVVNDTAIVRGRWHLQMSQESRTGLYTLVVKRLPEGWRIIHDHSS